ncbi:hypothetical protein DMC01_08155 [Campylobacter troglodytis]|nr:hypothetical protein DMC01_08155 [Campylobacter troglodytis]
MRRENSNQKSPFLADGFLLRKACNPLGGVGSHCEPTKSRHGNPKPSLFYGELWLFAPKSPTLVLRECRTF